MEGGKLVDSVHEYTFFSVSLLYMLGPQEDYVCIHVFQMLAHVGDSQERVQKINGSFHPLQTTTLFPRLSHVHTSVSLILTSST